MDEAEVFYEILTEAEADAERRKPRIARGGVYFIQSGRFIKIGMATSVRNRFSLLQAANPERLRPLGYIPEADRLAAIALELALHQQFAAHRYRAEWFMAEPEIMSYIQANATPWPMPRQ